MIKIGKHCYCTPKCGIITAKKLWTNYKSDKDFVFLQMRDPLNRIVSFYNNKAIIDPFLKKKPYQPLNVRNISFEEFIEKVKTLDLKKFEYHLGLQTVGVPLKFDHIVMLENYKDDIKVVSEELGIPVEQLMMVENSMNIFKKSVCEDDFYKSATTLIKKKLCLNSGCVPSYLKKQIKQIYHNDYEFLYDRVVI